MIMKIYWIPLLVLLVYIMMGCSSSQTDMTEYPGSTGMPLSTPIPSQPTQGEATHMNPLLPTTSAFGMEGLIDKAKQDLAQRLSIPISDINLVDAKEVVWSDGSLGCPQPDMLYTQAIMPGYLIKLKYDNREFEYHAGKSGTPMYCENPLPPFQDNT
jgi:hypothetical protein